MPWKEPLVQAQRCALVKMLLRQREHVWTVCRRFGVSRQTAYKFLRRFMAQGSKGLFDLCRRPHHTQSEESLRWRQRILRLRRSHRTWGAAKLCWLLRKRYAVPKAAVPTQRTVQRWLAAAGLTRMVKQRRRRAPPKGLVRSTIARRSNHIWTFDLKGWFRAHNGEKIEPLTIRDHWSRYVLWARSLSPRDERGVRRVCLRLFRQHGLPAVIRCDRGAPFFGDGPHGFTRLSLWWWRLGIRVEFVRRGVINNNAHEQMHGVLKAEVPIAATASAQARQLERWRRHFNEHRPHDALGLRTPASRYRPRPTSLPLLRSPRYSDSELVRYVFRSGDIRLPHWRGSIGRAFGGLPVALRLVRPEIYHVFFASLYLGELDLTGRKKFLLAPY